MRPQAKSYYEQRAKEGYGLMCPEGHVIRIYEHVLRSLLPNGASGLRLFDFGCWNGTHASYFADKGFQVCGADIIAEPIKSAAQRVKGHFEVIDDGSDLLALFPDAFDVIFTNQVLYFLDDITLGKRLQEFRRMLKPDGIFVATVISRNCFYAKHVKDTLPNGLEQIEFSDPSRLKGKTTACRFVDSPQQMRDMFSMFDVIQMGRYDCDLDLSHSTEHFIFIGRNAPIPQEL